jgi:hypothetical protein
MRGFGLIVSIAALCIAAGCAGSGTTQPTLSGPGQPGVEEPKWQNPIDGQEVTSIEEAQQLVAFEILVPDAFGSPVKILVTPPDSSSRGDRVVALLYEPDDYGLVVLKEHLPDVPIAEYEASNERIVEMARDSGAHGTARIVPVRGGLPALLTVSPDGSDCTIWWLEDEAFEIIVQGPDLVPEQCVEVANLV